MEPPVGVFSARADGATTIAVGLAACLSAQGRTLLIDLNLDSPEVAPLLDAASSRTLYHLAYNAQLAPVSPDELEEHIAWSDGLAVLPGITHPEHRDRISDHFIAGLLEAASRRFEHVVIDLGRIRDSISDPLATAFLIWVVSPTPLGMDALDRIHRRLQDRDPAWLASTRAAINRMSELSLARSGTYLEDEYGLETIGTIPDTPDYWRRVEFEHSVRALSIAGSDHPRFLAAHGEQALKARRAIESLATTVTAPRANVTAEVAGA